ncbi:tetratricopeptide repeat protein [Streptomyces sp. NPDC058457]|uniref:tetratricopeptide repeat protein n=1 Tax=Streptomyces sp. NPDC058457 TaxID=3346507 RepID=UPI00365F7501
MDDRDRTQENLRLLGQVDHAVPEELDRILASLSAEASTGLPSAVHLLAVGLASAGRMDEAIAAFRSAIERAPDRLEFRLNLAVAYVRVGQVDLAAATLDRTAALVDAGQVRLTGADQEQIRRAVQRRRDELAAWVRWRDDQVRLTRLRVGMLRERLAHGEGTANDRVQLATALLRSRHDSSTETLAEAAAVLEAVRAVEPRHVEALERLAHVYALLNDDRCDVVLRELEAVEPNSAVLRAFTVSDQDAAHHFKTMRARATALFELTITRGPETEAALTELRAIVRQAPENREYRGLLMFAEHVNGNVAQAMALAELQDARTDLSHAEHFNLAQVFWGQDEAQGRRHLTAAYQKASSAEERRDVEEMLVHLSERRR